VPVKEQLEDPLDHWRGDRVGFELVEAGAEVGFAGVGVRSGVGELVAVGWPAAEEAPLDVASGRLASTTTLPATTAPSTTMAPAAPATSQPAPSDSPGLLRRPWLLATTVAAALLLGLPRVAADASTPGTGGLAILHALGVREPPPGLLQELEQPGDRPPVEPFPEVPGVLERLRAGGIRMAIVSDNWPGLEHLYQRLGLDGYFQAFVISAVLGCRKPDPRMYRAGSDALGLPPHECVFVDDAPDLVAAAIRLNYGGTAIVRASNPPAGVPWIGTLEDLVPMTGT
jgi:HAD superfamily hydrolase (TIGR01509 family)